MAYECVWIYFIFFLGECVISSGANAKSCESTNECPKGYYCYKESETCSPCTDCAVYHRKPSAWKSCSEHPKECGGCLDGFEEEVLSNGRTRDICLPFNHYSSIPYTSPPKGEGLPNISLWWGALALVCFLIFSLQLTFYFTRKKRAQRPSDHICEEEEIEMIELSSDNPPPYSYKCEHEERSFCSPSAPPIEVNISHCKSASSPVSRVSSSNSFVKYPSAQLLHSVNFQICDGKKQEDNLQQANKWRDPDYEKERGNCSQSGKDFFQENNDGDAPGISIEPDSAETGEREGPNIHDENTMPSLWRPEAVQVSTENNGECEPPREEESGEPQPKRFCSRFFS